MLRNRFRRSYWYRNVAKFASVLLEHTWKYAILKLHLTLLKLHLKVLKLHRHVQTHLCFFKHVWLFVDFVRVFQKVFPRIPGGCRHQESAGNRVLDNVYRSCLCNICFDNIEYFKNELFQIVHKSFLKWTNSDKLIN